MIAFIDDQKESYGVESICKQLPVAVSTYYVHKARESDPDKVPERVKRDRWQSDEIQRVWDENKQVYGAEKVWCQLKREGFLIARCTVERLMKRLGLRGAVRGGAKRWTTISDDSQYRPVDRVNRRFVA